MRPSGTRFTIPAVINETRSAAVSTRLKAVATSATASGIEREQSQQKPVVGPLERGPGMPERASGGGQARSPAVRPDRRCLVQRRTLDRERAGPDRLPE